MTGTVEGVTPIPAPSNGSGQDVRVYYAMVEIDSGGFDDLRPGLSAEVTFLVEPPRTVTRVPLQAVRWVDGRRRSPRSPSPPPPAPRPRVPAFSGAGSSLGQSDPSYVEVVSGLRARRPRRRPPRPAARPRPRPRRAGRRGGQNLDGSKG